MTTDKSDKDESQPSADPLYEKLKEDIDESDWSMLESHHERKAVFLLSEEVDLVEAGIAMAKDDVDQVRSWMADQKLSTPKPEDVETWSNDLHQRFRFLIIQPYVLVQLVRKEQ